MNRAYGLGHVRWFDPDYPDSEFQCRRSLGSANSPRSHSTVTSPIARATLLIFPPQGVITELVALSIGAEKSQEIIRQALAMGADRGILMSTKMRTDQELQPLAIAKLIQKIVEKEDCQLVLCGKQAIDDDSNQTGQLLAGRGGKRAIRQC